MRHFYFSDGSGEIKGQAKSVSGWGDECDPSDPNTSCPKGQSVHQVQYVEGGMIQCAESSCPCPTYETGAEIPECDGSCDLVCGNYYIENGALVPKPAATLTLGGVTYPSGEDPIDFIPGTKLQFSVAANVPDGHQVSLMQEGLVSVFQGSPVLEFTGGVSNQVEITVPAQGMSCLFGARDKYFWFYLNIRGWQA